MSNNHIPESVYDTLVDVVNKHLPLLHRYMELRKRLLEVEKLHMYDLYTPVLGKLQLPLRTKKQRKALEALKPMGEEYMAIVEKHSLNVGSMLSKIKGNEAVLILREAMTQIHILLNWHDTLDQLFTLVHEMGHSVHSYFTRSNQPYVYGDYSIF